MNGGIRFCQGWTDMDGETIIFFEDAVDFTSIRFIAIGLFLLKIFLRFKDRLTGSLNKRKLLQHLLKKEN